MIIDVASKLGFRSNYSSITSGDLNGDKIDDLVMIGTLDNSPLISYGSKNAANGAFLPSMKRSGITSPTQVKLADINMDGKVDIVVLDRDSAGLLQVEAFFGKGDNAFADSQTIIASDCLDRNELQARTSKH